MKTTFDWYQKKMQLRTKRVKKTRMMHALKKLRKSVPFERILLIYSYILALLLFCFTFLILRFHFFKQEKALKSLNQELSIQYGSLNLFDNYLVRNHINNDLQRSR
jgi:hypothetical protein